MREALSAVHKYYITYSVEVKSLCKRGFWCMSTWIWNNVSNTSHVVCIYQILEKSGSLMGLGLISVGGFVLNVIEIGVPMKLFPVTQMCLSL
jgi:hypothetical protein